MNSLFKHISTSIFPLKTSTLENFQVYLLSRLIKDIHVYSSTIFSWKVTPGCSLLIRQRKIFRLFYYLIVKEFLWLCSSENLLSKIQIHERHDTIHQKIFKTFVEQINFWWCLWFSMKENWVALSKDWWKKLNPTERSTY